MNIARHKGMISDTPPAIKQILFAGYRAMSAAEKFDRIRQLNQFLEIAALSDIRCKFPDTVERDQLLLAAARRLPAYLVKSLGDRAFRKEKMMPSDPLSVIKRLTNIFDQLNIIYWIGGSVASSVYGEFRATQDVDFVADLKHEHVPLFVTACADEFYIDAEMINDAIHTQTSFNLIYLEEMYKADVFVMKQNAWSNEQKMRRQQKQMGYGDEMVSVYVASPEDIILQKLAWYRLGGGVSDRQWSDVQGVLGTQVDTLDYQYLRRWAEQLKLTELLQHAYEDTGIKLK